MCAQRSRNLEWHLRIFPTRSSCIYLLKNLGWFYFVVFFLTSDIRCLVHWFSNVFSKWVLVAQSCPTLCNPMDCSPPGSSVHGILQTRILEWVAISFSRGSSQPRDRTQMFCVAGRFFTIWATREAPVFSKIHIIFSLNSVLLKVYLEILNVWVFKINFPIIHFCLKCIIGDNSDYMISILGNLLIFSIFLL